MIGHDERNLLAQICKEASQEIVALANADGEPSHVDGDANEEDLLSNILLTAAATAESCSAPAVARVIEALASTVPDTARSVEQLERITDWLNALAKFLFEEVVTASCAPPECELVSAELVARIAEEINGEDTSHDSVGPTGETVTDENDKSQSGLIEVLSVFNDEIDDLRPRLTQALDDLTGAPEEAVIAADHCANLVNRIAEASRSLGMDGVALAAEFFVTNMRAAAEGSAEVRATVAGLGAKWPTLIQDYLQRIDASDRMIALVEFMQLDDWPSPLTDDAAKALLDVFIETSAIIDASSDGQPKRPKIAGAEDVLLDISPEVNASLVDAFFVEIPDQARKLVECIDQISGGKSVSGNLEAAQRHTHTIKGAANLIGVAGLANIAHHLEDLLDYFARHGVPGMSSQLCATLQDAADCIEAMTDNLQGTDEFPANAQEVLQLILDLAAEMDAGTLKYDFLEQSGDDGARTETDVEPPQSTEDDESEPQISQEIRDSRTVPEQADGSDLSKEQGSKAAADRADYLRVPRSTIDRLFRLVGEAAIVLSQSQEHVKRTLQRGGELRQQEQIVNEKRFELENLVGVRGFAGHKRQFSLVASKNEEFDSLELDSYDELYSTAHSYTEAVTDMRELNHGIHEQVSELDGLLVQQMTLNKELQDIVMATRMIPVGQIAARLHRAVRQAARATDKMAELEVLGTELMVDSDVLSRLTDALMHILRNAVDHGIEDPELRRTKGKSEQGKIVIEFCRARNDLIVVCSDDGAGLDHNKIRAVARNRQLLNEAELRDEALLGEVLLTPGFTTRTTVTQISGRGVGLDVVNSTIRGLKGRMQVTQADPCGCRVSLQLPISLITSHALLVEIGRERYAVPASALEQILPPESGDFRTIKSGLLFKYEDHLCDVRPLASLLHLEDCTDINTANRSTVLMVRAGSNLTAVLVDRVLTSHDFVIKPMGRFVARPHGIGGMSTLGDGTVVAVLDMPELLRSGADAGQATGGAARQAARQPQISSAAIPEVLIVDDSLSVRKSLQEICVGAGYSAVLARDGLEAIDKLRLHDPVVALVDLEMPNMNGLELTAHLRAAEQTAHLPVIMVTSRTQMKHRRQAKAAGVDEYVTKPFSEPDLLELMARLASAGAKKIA